MANSYFKFKRFTVWHDRCAMKVGTDGVLLGAWVPVGDYQHVLDVGTGTGLIALQLTQRMPDVRVVAVEIDGDAARQARENADWSPWGARIQVVCEDFNNFVSDLRFDLIVSNPPFFVDALKCPDMKRSLARHAWGGLNYDALLRRSVDLLRPGGKVCMVIPAEQEQTVLDVAWAYKLYPSHLVRVYTKPHKPCRRILLALSRELSVCLKQELYILGEDNTYSQEYVNLVKDFYWHL